MRVGGALSQFAHQNEQVAQQLLSIRRDQQSSARGATRLGSTPPHGRPPSACTQRNTRARKRETKSYFYGKLRSGCGAISQVHLNKSIKADPNMRRQKKTQHFSAFLTFGSHKLWPGVRATKHGLKTKKKKTKRASQLAQFHQLNVLKQKSAPLSSPRVPTASGDGRRTRSDSNSTSLIPIT